MMDDADREIIVDSIEDLEKRVAVLESNKPVASWSNYKNYWEALKEKLKKPNDFGHITWVGVQTRRNLLEAMRYIELDQDAKEARK